MKFAIRRFFISILFTLTSQLAFSFIKMGEFETLYSPIKAVEHNGALCFLTRSGDSSIRQEWGVPYFLEIYSLRSPGKLKRMVSFKREVATIKVIGDKLYALTNDDFSGIRNSLEDQNVRLISLSEKNVQDFIYLNDKIYVIHEEAPYLTKISIETSKVEEIEELPDFSNLDRIFSYDDKILTLEHKANYKARGIKEYYLKLYHPKSFNLLASTLVEGSCAGMAIEGDQAYILDSKNSQLLIINLKNFEVKKTFISVPECTFISVPDYLDSILLKDGILYVNFEVIEPLLSSAISAFVRVIDLNKKFPSVSVRVPGYVKCAQILKDCIYVCSLNSKSVSIYSVAPSVRTISTIINNETYFQYYGGANQFDSSINEFFYRRFYSTLTEDNLIKNRLESFSNQAQLVKKSNSLILFDLKEAESPLGLFQALPIELIA